MSKPVSDWTLASARARDALMITVNPGHAPHDVRELLALVDNMSDYLQHEAGCPPAATAGCDCGLAELLRRIRG